MGSMFKIPPLAVLAFSAIWLLSAHALAVISFELPEIEVVAVEGSPTTGSFQVLVRVSASDLPQSVAGVNLHFGTDAGSLVLGPPEAATANPLFSDGDFTDFSPDIFTVRISDNGLTDQALADGLSLVQVPFTVPSGVTGDFNLQFLSSNSLVDGLAQPLSLDLTDTGLIRIVEPAVPGDYDGNGSVDSNDYTIWRDTLGSTEDLRANGDDTGPSAGVIDSADYTFWKSQYEGTTVGTLSHPGAPVPEPSTALMSLAIVVVFSATRYALTPRLRDRD